MTEIKFGTDGWRAIVGDDFTLPSVRRAAQGVAEYVRGRTAAPLVVVGYDCRFGSELFAEEVARVLAGNGVRSLLFDRPSPTQVASWTVIERGAAGAVVVTASHNPYLFNGLKYKPETGSSAPPEVTAELERLIAGICPGSVRRSAPDDPLIERHDPRPAYFAQLARLVDLDALRMAGIRIVHDCMHGSAYGYLADLLNGGATTLTELHGDRNPCFGGVNPEPMPSNLAQARCTMRSGGFDLCVATDGDGDRVGIIDETGRFVDQLQAYALLMRYLVEGRGWRGPVVKSMNMTAMADRLGERYGVPVHEVPVGFRNALCFADMIARERRPLGEILCALEADVGPHAYARHDIHLPRETYADERRCALQRLGARAPAVIAGVPVDRVRDDDGYKFFLRDGSWAMLRASGTEPLIRVYSEAGTPDQVQARLHALEEVAGIQPPD